MTRYVCIHGHFYQPPRENPWLEEVELQDSAHPYHDWNERITSECYAPNTAARIFGPDRKIIDIINNYKNISYDFGPTLLSWMEAERPETLQEIIDAGRASETRFSGHSPAMAQAYSHMILPLSNLRDKRTQVIWGIKEYEHRLGKRPEGMWLPETAVDRKSLDIMAEMGIKFTILAPHQVARFRKIGETKWKKAPDGLDIKRPYLCRLESGRSISIFIYDDQIAKDVAFTNLLDNGEAFADRLAKAFSGEQTQLVHIATDGETYGHHHWGGDMALAYCLYHIESKNLAKIAVYGEYLERHPPVEEVEIVENTSWSCPHGVGRWMSDCGCNTGAHPGWNQGWRAPLRAAMDWLRDSFAAIYEKDANAFLKDPWVARDDYVEVILNRSPENVEKFLAGHASGVLSSEGKVKALKLLEMQRHAMFMYTSDGWFFDEISGIESVQVMKYAARAMQLAREVSGEDLEPKYLELLKQAKSNIPEFEDGKQIYEKQVRPATLDLLRVAAHYAISSLFKEYPEKAEIFCYTVTKESHSIEKAGEQSLATGKVRVRSNITWEEEAIGFAVLHFGGHNMIGGAHWITGDDPHQQMQQEIKNAFVKGDITEVIRLMDRHFGDHSYSIWHLFKDEQRRILNLVLEPDLKEIDVIFHQEYEHHYPALQVMRELGVPLPQTLKAIADSVIDRDIHSSLEEEKIDMKRLRKLAEDVRKFALQIDKQSLNLLAGKRLEGLMERLNKNPEDQALMEETKGLLDVEYDLTLQPSLWKSQNILFSLSRRLHKEMKERSDRGDQQAARWLELQKSIEDRMQVRTS